MTEKYLFIGGSHDGTRRAVSTLAPVVVLQTVSTSPRIPYKQLPNVYIEYEQYKWFPIRTGNTDFTIYAIETLKPEEILELLISKYPAPPICNQGQNP